MLNPSRKVGVKLPSKIGSRAVVLLQPAPESVLCYLRVAKQAFGSWMWSLATAQVKSNSYRPTHAPPSCWKGGTHRGAITYPPALADEGKKEMNTPISPSSTNSPPDVAMAADATPTSASAPHNTAAAAAAPPTDNSNVPKPKRLACMICRKRKLKASRPKPSEAMRTRASDGNQESASC
ncbi:hypothetical protein OOU_Y34scaffold00576g8 [Pyricularia oryzae Y34]|uniref:Uncharacterized protein n=2 Tax=Pyricularia oryzae TaxID=318829 RepID=A0AA97NWU7_PYRO3|nr:hypothetical protein OOU_Y34scaffold00576g8 [Pyricularia oryzae Y34]